MVVEQVDERHTDGLQGTARIDGHAEGARGPEQVDGRRRVHAEVRSEGTHGVDDVVAEISRGRRVRAHERGQRTACVVEGHLQGQQLDLEPGEVVRQGQHLEGIVLPTPLDPHDGQEARSRHVQQQLTLAARALDRRGALAHLQHGPRMDPATGLDDRLDRAGEQVGDEVVVSVDVPPGIDGRRHGYSLGWMRTPSRQVPATSILPRESGSTVRGSCASITTSARNPGASTPPRSSPAWWATARV